MATLPLTTASHTPVHLISRRRSLLWGESGAAEQFSLSTAKRINLSDWVNFTCCHNHNLIEAHVWKRAMQCIAAPGSDAVSDSHNMTNCILHIHIMYVNLPRLRKHVCTWQHSCKRGLLRTSWVKPDTKTLKKQKIVTNTTAEICIPSTFKVAWEFGSLCVLRVS